MFHLMARWTRKRAEPGDRWIVLRDHQPVGVIYRTPGGRWAWRCDVTDQEGESFTDDSALDVVRALTVLELERLR